MEEKKPSGLAAKMAAAMAEVGRVEKRGRNTAQDYKYARADDVAEQTRGVLAKHGIALFADVLEDGVREIVIPPAKEGFTGKTLRVSRVRVAWTFVDSETGESRTVHTPGEGMDSGDKGIYKAMTGAMKYALMLGFLIPTGDGDPERASEADEVETNGGSNAEKLRAKVAAATKPPEKPDTTPKTPADRKADVKRRLTALGFRTGEAQARALSGWLGVKVTGETEITPEMWRTADGNLHGLEEGRGILGANDANQYGLNN